MDISLCIDHLGLNRNEYRLTQSVPPHSITGWSGPDPQPTQVELEAAWGEWQSEYDAQDYARNRAEAYASIGDQLDMQYWDSVNDTTTWKDHIASVKDQFQKV